LRIIVNMARLPIKTISATDLRLNLSDIIADIKKEKRHMLITKSGKPVAVLVSMDEYEQLIAARIKVARR